MAALYSNTIAPGGNSGNITVTANTLHHVQSDVPGVIVESYNNAATAWNEIAKTTAANQSVAFTAPSETLRVRNPASVVGASAKVDVF